MKTVFFGADPSIVRWAYTDIINSPDIDYCDFVDVQKTKFRSLLLSRKLQRLSFRVSKKLSKCLYSYLLGYNFLKSMQRDDTVLFVFTCQYQYFFLTSFFTYIHFLKNEYPNAKFAFYYNDIIETCYPEALPTILKEFDWVLTFDKFEAQKYGMIYYGEVCSKNEISKKYDIDKFDVFYVGSDRGRLSLILSAFNRLIKLGKKCRFYLYDVLPQNMTQLNEFISEHSGTPLNDKCTEYDIRGSYLSINNYCPYPKTLWLIMQCKCLLEIVLPGQKAGSLRAAEANIYQRKLITNCASIKSRDFYNKNNICIFGASDDITDDFFKYSYIDINHDFSPLRLIEFIKQQFESHKHN